MGGREYKVLVTPYDFMRDRLFIVLKDDEKGVFEAYMHARAAPDEEKDLPTQLQVTEHGKVSPIRYIQFATIRPHERK